MGNKCMFCSEVNSELPPMRDRFWPPICVNLLDRIFFRSTTILLADTHLELTRFITHYPTVVARMMTTMMMKAWLVLASAANRKLFWKAILAFFHNEGLEKMSQRGCERRQRRQSLRRKILLEVRGAAQWQKGKASRRTTQTFTHL